MVKVKLTFIDSKREEIREFKDMNEMLDFTVSVEETVNIQYIGSEKEKMAFLDTINKDKDL